jgi:tetratricopeptide (TPR) repeat protein
VIPIRSLSSKFSWGLLTGPLLFCLLLVACTVSSEDIEYSRAEQAQQKNDYQGALKHYKAVVERYIKTPLAIKAAKEAAKINHYQFKQPKEAIVYYKHIVLYSNSASERLEAQKKIADLHFSQTLDYAQAIIEFSRLLDLPHSSQEDFTYRLSIARCYFYLSNFYQAQVEIDSILGRNYEKDILFDALLLKANIFLTTKKLDDAIATLRQLMDKYPDRSKAETIGLVLAVVYEEQKNFAKAIETLESIKGSYPKKGFIEQRIKILRERQSYLPGARGFKK